jgi:hypothetical protein
MISYSVEECDSILLAHIDITMEDIVDICMAMRRGAELIYTDSSLICNLGNSVEFAKKAKNEGEARECSIPDMGSIISMINSAVMSSKRVTLVGKPNMMMDDGSSNSKKYDVVVGDSESDYLLSQRLGAAFVQVGQKKDRYNFEYARMELIDIGHL